MEGTYSDPTGAVVLKLDSGGTANFTFAGQSAPCTYKADGKKISVTCPGDATPVVWTVQDDGSLAPPQDSVMQALRLRKK